MKRKILSLIMAVLMITTCLVSPAMASQTDAQTSETHSPNTAFEAVYNHETGETTYEPAKEQDTTEVEILVAVNGGSTVFMETSDPTLAVASADRQMNTLYAAASSVESALGMALEDADYYCLLFNGFAFKGEAWMVDVINQMDGLTAAVVPMFQVYEPESEDSDVDLTPNMATSTNMTGAVNAWDLGYTGKGMVVAVIDSGIRQTHEAFSVAPEGAKMDKAYIDNIFAQHGDTMHSQNLEGAYYNAKLPFNWDFFDDDVTPNHTYTDHGSHVAGIVAGNNGKDFKGIAPDAQIVSFQVSQKNGAMYTSDILNALEDSVYLGVDAVNMSLGIAAGFESYQWPIDFQPVYEAMDKAGIAVCCAAGNAYHAYISTSYKYYSTSSWRWPSENMDNGMIDMPGTYAGSFTVGNTLNMGKEDQIKVIAGGYSEKPVASTNAETPTFAKLTAGNYELVLIGSGSLEDIQAAGGAKGKIALAAMGGTVSDAQKCANAAAAGAVGILMYDSTKSSGTAVLDVYSPIPFGTLASDFVKTPVIKWAMNGGNTCTMTLDIKAYPSTVTMSKSSSWGPTANLKIKPEISAPGDNIVSVAGGKSYDDSSYTKKTGTSMATPAVAGGMLLLKEYLSTLFPNATGKELTDKAYAIMMSTADQVNAFVRQQGAGLMNLEDAIKTTAYLTTAEDLRPKLELGDSADGTFDISFKVHNFGTSAKTYDIDFTALTELVQSYTHVGLDSAGGLDYTRRWGMGPVLAEPAEVKVIGGKIKDVTSLCTLEGVDAITVRAGDTATVTLTLKADEDLMKHFEENCPSGMYLEGWIKLIDRDAENGVELTIPYLGFVGDWDYPAMIDEGWWWQEDYGVNNMAQFYTSNEENGGGIYLGYDTLEQGLGLNFYWDETGETYVADRNALSPNGDGWLDALTTLEFALLRQPRTVKLYVRDGDGNILQNIYDNDYGFRRDYQTGNLNGGVSYCSVVLDYDCGNMKENETAYFVLETYLDHEGFELENNKLGKIEIPFTKDTTAPAVTAIDGGVEILDTNYIAYYAVYADAQRNEMIFEDGVFAMERGVAETYTTDMDEYFVAVADYAHNEAFYYVADGNVYEMDASGFDHGRTIIAQSYWDMNYFSSNYTDPGCVGFAWHSFSSDMKQGLVQLTETSTEKTLSWEKGSCPTDILGVGRTADGRVYAADCVAVFTFDPITYERGKPVFFWEKDNENVIFLKSFLVAPGTNNLYGFAVLNNRNPQQNFWFVAINPETGELTRLWKSNYSSYCSFADMKDEDTVIVLNTNKMLLDEFNVFTGEQEASVNTDMRQKSGRKAFGPRGYHWTGLYDAQENCFYMAGAFSYFRFERYSQGGVLRYDYDTGELEFMTPGDGNGTALFGLYFLDEMVPAEEQKCVYYRQEIAPTCDTEGYTLHTCADCGHEYRDNFVPALGHTYEGIVTEPTCTDMGYTTYTCTVCGDSYVADYTLPVDHEFVEVVIEPTCTEAGYTIYMCECGYEEIGDVVDPVGHDYEEVVIEPTCEDYGYTMYVCAVCGDSFVSEYTAPVCPAEKFSDVDTKQWYHEGVCYVIRNGLMNGKSETVFAPNANLTRAELVTVLYRMAGSPSVEDLEHPFADVADDTWYTDAVIWAYNAEVVKGISETAFAPNANITREQIATILYRYAGAEVVEEDSLKGFTDAGKVSAWAVDAMNWAVSVGLINGVAEGELAPQGNATRAQIATILMRYCEG